MAIHKLTPARIAKLTKDGMYGDGGGLWLQVRDGGRAKSWAFRWSEKTVNGVRGRGRVMGLGAIYKTSMEEARELAKAQWQLIKKGLDPIEVRDGVKLDEQHKLGLAKTVNQVIDEFLDAKINFEKRAKRTKYLVAHVLKHARRTIGDLPIQKIDTNMILDKVGLRQMWTERHVTATQLQSHLTRMFSLAIANKYYVGKNPAIWKDNLEHILPQSGDVHTPVPRASLFYADIWKFMEALRACDKRGSNFKPGRPTSALWLEFCVLTGCRISEARLATWSEIDRTNMIWTVPAMRADGSAGHKTARKTKAVIRRPISKAMLAVLDQMAERHPDHAPDAPIFPSPQSRGRPFYGVVHASQFLVRVLKWPGKIHTHGFRNTFMDWCRDKGGVEWEHLASLQFAHVIGDKVHRAYARDDLIEKRRPIMEAWGEYCSRPAPEPMEGTANVASLIEHKNRKHAS